MSIAEQIIPEAQKLPYAEIVRPAHNDWPAHINHFEGLNGASKGDALTALGTINYCFEVNIPAVEIHKIPRLIAKELAGTDSVIIGHGPLSERASGIPSAGRDNQYQGWHGMTDNDGELTIISTLPEKDLKHAVETGMEGFKSTDLDQRNGWNGLTEIKSSNWQEPSWNVGNPVPKINQFINSSYTYWGHSEYPAFDIHFISGQKPINDFLTIYGNRYSNIFGARFLACFINKDGSLEQKIWQPIKPEQTPKNHLIKLIKHKELMSVPWLIPEIVKMAIDTVRYSGIVKRPAEIDPDLIPDLKESLYIQADLVRKIKGDEWLRQKAQKKLETAYHRSELFYKKRGPVMVREQLEKVGWFDAVGIKPLRLAVSALVFTK